MTIPPVFIGFFVGITAIRHDFQTPQQLAMLLTTIKPLCVLEKNSHLRDKIITSMSQAPDYTHLKKLATQIRRDIVRMVHACQSGHPGGSLGCTEFFVALYFHLMKHNASPFDLDGKGEDLFFLSNGHISPVWYATLARSGYFPVEELATFRQINSRLQGHPTTHEGLPGVRVA